MPASLDDAAPDERRRALVLQTMLTLFAEDAKERAACATMLEAHCDAVGNHYPGYVLKDRAPPVSSRRTDARRRRRESVERPGRAVRRSASSARPRGRRTIASHAVETRTDTLNAALPLLEMVIQHAPGINGLPVAVSDPVPRDGRFGARSNSLAVPRNRAGPARPRHPLDAPQVPFAPIWRAFAAFTQSDVGKFAHFVERADPYDVRFTLPVVMCAYVFDSGFIDAFKVDFDREAFTATFGRAVTCEAVGFFRHHSPHFADGAAELCLLIAHLMVDGSVEKLKFLMMGAHGGCGMCARLAMDHLEREDPAREVPRPLF